MSELGFTPISEHDPDRRPLIDHFLQLVARATNFTDRLSRFPGTMPMTLSRRHLDMVCQSDYVCLEKSDGTRYMLFAIESHVVLIDRRLQLYVIDPNPKLMSPKDNFQTVQNNTILDGELTYNLITLQWEYLIYDVIAIDSDLSIAQLGFRQRMQAAECFIAGPRVWSTFCAGLLRLRIKDFYERNDIRNLFEHIRKDPSGKYIYLNNDRRDGVLCNENDGVIFAPVKLCYQLKNSNFLLKWKPPHLNSVDFQLRLTKIIDQKRKEPSVRVVVAFKGDGNGLQELRDVYVPFKLRSYWNARFDYYNNSIAEFAYDRNAGEWRYMRQRDDKDIPNFQNTIISTLETIAEGVEREEMVLKMEKTAHPPSDEKVAVQLNYSNARKGTFRNDYFDHHNNDYIMATPISTIPPPSFPRSRHYQQPQNDARRGGRQHQQSRREPNQSHNHSNANGDSARRREEKPSTLSDRDQKGRAPFVYADDI